MTLTVNINDITRPVFTEARKSSFIKKNSVKNYILGVIENWLEKRIKKLIKTTNDAALQIEGSYAHLKQMSPDKAMLMLDETKTAVSGLEKYDEKLAKSNYLDNHELKVKYKYLLKAIHKAEAISHKIAYSDKATNKTDKSIKDGIIKMNSNLIKKSVG